MTNSPRRLSLITPSSRQAPFLEYTNGTWRIWQSFNPSVTAGTYLELSSDGGVDRVTISPDGLIKNITTVVTPEQT